MKNLTSLIVIICAMLVLAIIFNVSLVVTAHGQGITWKASLQAIRTVETGGMPNGGIGALGDGGKAYGPYQIWKPYWIDSGVKGSHAQCLNSKAYSEKVMQGYMLRYAPREFGRLVAGTGKVSDLEKVARIHNGGPKGYKRNSTLKYWAKIKKLIP